MWIAPTEKLEQDLIDFCVSELNLPFGEFWYKWFASSRVKDNGNHTIHIDTSHVIDETFLRSKLITLPFVEKIFKVQRIHIHGLDVLDDLAGEYKYQYFIHIKTNIFTPNRLLL